MLLCSEWATSSFALYLMQHSKKKFFFLFNSSIIVKSYIKAASSSCVICSRSTFSFLGKKAAEKFNHLTQ